MFEFFNLIKLINILVRIFPSRSLLMVLPGMYPDYDEELRIKEEARKIELTKIETTTEDEDWKKDTLIFMKIVTIEKIKPPPMEVIRLEYPFFYKFMNMFSFGCEIVAKFRILILPFSLTFF